MKPSYIKVDKNRQVIIPGDAEMTLHYAVEKWVEIAQESIQEKQAFFVALSGGSTPKKIFQLLTTDYKNHLDWSKVYLFWSDERAVPPSDPASNFHMAMYEGGLEKLPIPTHQVFRMVAEEELEKNAALYEKVIFDTLGAHPFDLIMLGMGEDGHTASLFPHTQALKEKDKWVVPNYIPAKKTWRMTFTYPCINSARHIYLYVLGPDKAGPLEKVFNSLSQPDLYPSQAVGTSHHPATWVVDLEASKNLPPHLKS